MYIGYTMTNKEMIEKRKLDVLNLEEDIAKHRDNIYTSIKYNEDLDILKGMFQLLESLEARLKELK